MTIMDFSTEINSIKDIIAKSQDILLVTHENPTFDSMGSTLALFLGLQTLGKKVTVLCPSQIIVELSNFIGVNKVMQNLGKKNFVISLDYTEGSIEKVSYNIEGDKFNLVIEPRPGFEAWSSDKVHFSQSGVKADAILCVDTIHLGGLKHLYENDKDLYSTHPVINIDRHPNNTHYGQVNIVDASVSTCAELVSMILSALGIHLTEDIATNLLNALFYGTNNFQSPYVTGRTFDLAAACAKAGGKKFQKGQATTSDESVVPHTVHGTPGQSPSRPATAIPGNNNLPPQEEQKQNPQKANEAPADWLKPKIFNSSSHNE